MSLHEIEYGERRALNAPETAAADLAFEAMDEAANALLDLFSSDRLVAAIEKLEQAAASLPAMHERFDPRTAILNAFERCHDELFDELQSVSDAAEAEDPGRLGGLGRRDLAHLLRRRLIAGVRTRLLGSEG